MNNLDEGSTIIGEDESEQKGIAGLNELLEQDLKEADSVDHYIPLQCFMEDDVRKYTPKLKPNHEGETPPVPDTTLYSPKEGESTDNNSCTLDTALEIPNNTEKEVPLKTTNGADNLQSCEGNASGTDFLSKEMDIADQGTNDIKTTGEDDLINKNGLDPAENEEEGSLVSEEASDLKDESNEEHNVVEQNGEGSSEEETNKESETAVEANDSEEVASQLEMESSVSTEALQSEMESSVPPETSQPEIESVPKEASQSEMESSVPEEASESEMESNVPEEASQSGMESTVPEEASQSGMESNVPEEVSQSGMESNVPEEASQSEIEGSVPEEALEEMETENSVPKEASQSEMESSVPEESEEAGNSQSAQDENENASGATEGILHDALLPEDETTELKENTTSTDTGNASNPVPDKPPLSPVFKLSSSSEAKKAKETNKPVIITARIVTNDGEVTTKTTNTCIVIDKNTEHTVSSLKAFRLVKVSPVKTKAADNSGVSDITSTEDTVSNTESAESDEKKHMSDEAKREETKTEVQSDDAVHVTVSPQTFILTKKVYGNTKKSPSSVQEKNLTSTEASSTDNHEHHCTTDEDQDVNMDSGVKVSRKSKVLVGKEGNNTCAKSVMEENVGGSCTEKGYTDFAGVKRKFDEISRKSRQEEEDAIKEIKKMKKETLDILKKINGEMKKLKSIFLAGN